MVFRIIKLDSRKKNVKRNIEEKGTAKFFKQTDTTAAVFTVPI